MSSQSRIPTKQQLMAAGPPYPPTHQALGSPAKAIPDVPVSAVFLALYALTGIGHMAVLQRNNKRGHKFLLSGAMFAYCLMRVITMILRILTVYNPRDIPLGLAAGIFVAVGTVVLYVINLFFAQRLVRSRHAHIGWHPSFRYILPVIPIALTAICIIMVIVTVIQSFYTLNERTKKIDLRIQQAVLTWFAVVAFIPLTVIALILILPRKSQIDKFGAGRYRTKLAIVAAASTVLTLAGAFRAGLNFLDPTPLGAPVPWYYSKAVFYIFDFTFEYSVVLAYLILRVDKRFHVQNGAHGYGSYGAGRGEKAVDVDDAEADQARGSDDAGSSPDKKRPSASISNGKAGWTGTSREADKDADTASVASDTFALGVNRKSGRYEMRPVSQSTLGTHGEVGYVETEGRGR